MTVIWIREHSGVRCNKRADDLVRRVATNPVPEPGLNSSMLHQQIYHADTLGFSFLSLKCIVVA